jgi:hypothetical protein
MKRIFACAGIVLLASGCSALLRRTTYLAPTNDPSIRPVCSTWNSTNGAGLTTFEGAHIVLSPGGSGQTLLAGPLFIPFIPIHPFRTEMQAHLQVQVLPPEGRGVRLPLQSVSLKYDGKAVPITSGSYLYKGPNQSEVTSGLLEGEQVRSELMITQPYMITLSGEETEIPERIEAHLSIEIGEERKNIAMSFEKDDSTRYIPLLIPDADGPVICQTDLPGTGKKHHFF